MYKLWNKASASNKSNPFLYQTLTNIDSPLLWRKSMFVESRIRYIFIFDLLEMVPSFCTKCNKVLPLLSLTSMWLKFSLRTAFYMRLFFCPVSPMFIYIINLINLSVGQTIWSPMWNVLKKLSSSIGRKVFHLLTTRKVSGHLIPVMMITLTM